MVVPSFIADLRSFVGSRRLQLVGVTAVVLRPGPHGRQQVLLVQGRDEQHWGPVTGILEPDEQPAHTAKRECLEETGVLVSPSVLVSVYTSAVKSFPNGDVAQFLEIVFRCDWISGLPQPIDAEVESAAWFGIDELPTMSSDAHSRIAAAMRATTTADFVPAP